MWAFMRKVRQCPTKIQKMFEPSGLFEALQREFCEVKEEEGKSCASQALIRLNNYISKKCTLVGQHNLSRMIAIRLSGAEEEEHAQYTSGAHLLQWISSPLLDGYSQGGIMRSLRILQIDGYLSKEERLVPRADPKKKPRARGIQKNKQGHDVSVD